MYYNIGKNKLLIVNKKNIIYNLIKYKNKTNLINLIHNIFNFVLFHVI